MVKFTISCTLSCLILPQPIQRCGCLCPFVGKLPPRCFTHRCVWTGCKRKDYNRFHDRNHAQNECGGLCLGGKNHCGFCYVSVFQGRVGNECPHERIERMASAGRCQQRVHHQLANDKSTSDRTSAILPSLDEFCTVKSLKNNAIFWLYVP